MLNKYFIFGLRSVLGHFPNVEECKEGSKVIRGL